MEKHETRFSVYEDVEILDHREPKFSTKKSTLHLIIETYNKPRVVNHSKRKEGKRKKEKGKKKREIYKEKKRKDASKDA
jgi:hypothetical protein